MLSLQEVNSSPHTYITPSTSSSRPRCRRRLDTFPLRNPRYAPVVTECECASATRITTEAENCHYMYLYLSTAIVIVWTTYHSDKLSRTISCLDKLPKVDNQR